MNDAIRELVGKLIIDTSLMKFLDYENLNNERCCIFPVTGTIGKLVLYTNNPVGIHNIYL